MGKQGKHLIRATCTIACPPKANNLVKLRRPIRILATICLRGRGTDKPMRERSQNWREIVIKIFAQHSPNWIRGLCEPGQNLSTVGGNNSICPHNPSCRSTGGQLADCGETPIWPQWMNFLWVISNYRSGPLWPDATITQHQGKFL